MKPLAFSLAIGLTIVLSGTHARELEGTYLPTNTPCPTPEEARAKMTVPEGYEVRCFAHEPMLQNPVAMTWDARGRLWVVEAYEYPEGSEHPAPFGTDAKHDRYQPMPNMGAKIPRDRVIILEDTDNNGEADKRTVFVEGLNLASAILCGDNGIYVGQQPHLIHFLDADQDDKPEQWRVVLTGFGREDTHELVNSFCWGPDGWLYMTHGVFTHSKVRRPGQPENEGFKFDAGIGRCRPLNRGKEAPWEFEVFADGTSNPWGCDYDERGNFFVSACVIDHFFHMAPGGIYVRQGGAPENPYAYEQLPSIVKHKHFRAAYAGVQIYQGGVYPKDTWGHAFIGNIHDNAIHEEIITPVGASFKCEPRRDFLRANDGWFRPVSTQTGPDGNLWIMDWCDKYPCYQNAKANPDGVDRSYGRIWRVVHVGDERSADTPVHKERLRASNKSGDAQAGKSARAPVASRPKSDMNLSKLTTEQLVKQLENPNNWMRRMARRLLVERNDLETTKVAVSKVSDNAPPPIKLECLYTMHGLGAANGSLLSKLLMNPDPAMRAWAARLTGESWRSKFLLLPTVAQKSQHLSAESTNGEDFKHALGRLRALSRDLDPSVRHAAAVAIRQWSAGCLTVNKPTLLIQNPKYGWPILGDLFFTLARDEWQVGATPAAICLFNEKDHDPGKPVKRAPPDALTRFAAWQAMQPILSAQGPSGRNLFDFSDGAGSVTHRDVQVKACRYFAETGSPETMGKLIRSLSGGWGVVDLGACLEALLKGQEARVTVPQGDLTTVLAKWSAAEDQKVRSAAKKLCILWNQPQGAEFLRAIVFDKSLQTSSRIEALQLSQRVSKDLLKEAVSMVLFDELTDSPELALAAVRLLPSFPKEANVMPWVEEHWRTLDLPLRHALAEAVASREDWRLAFLTAISEKRIPAEGIPQTIVRSFLSSNDERIHHLAVKVFGTYRDSSNDVKAIIEAKRKACIEGEPDLAAGKLLFTTTCAVCHVFHGGGQKVGPDLIGSGRSNLDALLANVIDPNQIIGNGYENIIISTKDNRMLMGRITEDTPSHVKLLAIGGAEQVVPRDQIAKLENTKQSLMPMGFGGLPDDQFRNLIWYILAPPEEGPLTPEKKKLLSTSIDAAPEKPKSPWRNIDWESVSLWNPAWKVNAPDFERTPLILADYHGQKNVLLMHPFPDKKTPASLEFKGMAKSKLKFSVAADDRGDWMLKVLVNGQPAKELIVDHEKPRWKEVVVDLSSHAGKEVTVRLEGHANGWAWEFGYWSGVKWE
ncbi:MAG: c-type cytochrome [Verrucomicrobiaceae bacterium]|nr:c-type cytochrome [Verrucomicrobiaceae bacterium]